MHFAWAPALWQPGAKYLAIWQCACPVCVMCSCGVERICYAIEILYDIIKHTKTVRESGKILLIMINGI